MASDTVMTMGPGEAEMYLIKEKLSFSTILFPLSVVLPTEDLKETVPVYAAGILKLPPKSPPIPNGTHFAETRPASPPELPPTVLVLSKGFNPVPHTLFVV